MNVVDQDLSQAVVTFLGSPGVSDPTAPEQRVAALLGDRALDVVPKVRSILAGLEAVTPPFWNTASLRDMGSKVEQWLRTHHPELDEKAVEAVANSYTFAWK